MIDSVKTISTNPLGEPFERAGINRRCIWQLAVKASVEYSHLENCPDAFLDDLDPVEFGTIMKRRKDRHLRYCGFHFRCDGGCFNEVLAAVHDSMTYCVDFGRRGNDAQLPTP